MRRLTHHFLATFLFLTVGPALSSTLQVNSQVQVGFSPEGTARTLVLDVIGSAKNQILLMGYSFTSPEIVKALITAKRNGIDVKVVLDKKANTGRSWLGNSIDLFWVS